MYECDLVCSVCVYVISSKAVFCMCGPCGQYITTKVNSKCISVLKKWKCR